MPILEIAGDALHFPIAVAHGIGTFAAADLKGAMVVNFGCDATTLMRFGECALRRGVQIVPLRSLCLAASCMIHEFHDDFLSMPLCSS